MRHVSNHINYSYSWKLKTFISKIFEFQFQSSAKTKKICWKQKSSKKYTFNKLNCCWFCYRVSTAHFTSSRQIQRILTMFSWKYYWNASFYLSALHGKMWEMQTAEKTLAFSHKMSSKKWKINFPCNSVNWIQRKIIFFAIYALCLGSKNWKIMNWFFTAAEKWWVLNA